MYNSKFRRGYLPLLCVILLISAGCATVGTGSGNPEIDRIAKLISTAPVDKLALQSRLPFVFDRELLYRAQDVAVFWSALRNQNFDIRTYTVTNVSKVSKDSYRLFANSFEMKTFFRRSVPPGATVAEILSEGRSITLLFMSGDKRPVLGIAIGNEG